MLTWRTPSDFSRTPGWEPLIYETFAFKQIECQRRDIVGNWLIKYLERQLHIHINIRQKKMSFSMFKCINKILTHFSLAIYYTSKKSFYCKKTDKVVWLTLSINWASQSPYLLFSLVTLYITWLGLNYR